MKQKVYIYMEDFDEAAKLAKIIKDSFKSEDYVITSSEREDWKTGKVPIIAESEKKMYKIYFEED